MPVKKPLPFKKKIEVKKSIQPKKEYKEVVKPKKEVIPNPDEYISVCMTRGEAYMIKNKFKDNTRLQDLFTRVLELQV
jgi:hypothetical protein